MSAPVAPTDVVHRTVWYARPGIVLPVLGVALLVSTLLTRTVVDAREGDPRLTTYSTEPQGAALLYELSAKLGYRAKRAAMAHPTLELYDVVAVLDPTIALRPEEVHQLLQHVREGGGLITALGNGTDALSDSIGIEVDKIGSSLSMPTGELPRPGKVPNAEDCPVVPITFASLSQQKLWIGTPTLFGLKGGGLENVARTYVYVRGTSSPGKARDTRPAMVGLNFGGGRIVVASDPDVFRNDALRECSYGFDVATAHGLEFLQAHDSMPRASIVFDEFHLGRGPQVGVIGSVNRYLGGTPSGHAIIQLAIAGLVLLLAFATRVLPPRDTDRVDRRSPLEHVDALARAYAQVGATRTAALRLVRGLRRRIDRGTVRKATSDADEAFLLRIADATPRLKPDIELVRKALDSRSSREEFRQVGNAVARIEAEHYAGAR